MDTRLLLAWVHLLALGVGLAGVWARGRALRDSLRDPEDRGALRRAFVAHIWWEGSIVLWFVSGIWLVLGTGRTTSFSFGFSGFLAKTALVLAIVALELWPMVTFFRWRRRTVVPEPRDAGRIEAISYVQCVLVVATVLAAVNMSHRSARVMPVGTIAPGPDTAVAGAPVKASDTLDAPPVTPSGVEIVTEADLALLAREIAMPLDGIDPASLRSNFDERRGGGTRQHQALDMMAPRRTPIRSAATGRVLKLFTSAAGGLMIYAADSSERFVLMYAHLDGYAPELRDGAPLVRGQVIGYVGSTGNASPTAPHLHFAIARSADVKRWSRGKPIDPVPVLQAAARGAVP